MSVRLEVPSEDMLMALGAGTLHWSLLESALDALVAMVFHRFDGRKIEAELPRMMGRKLKFLKRGFHRSPKLAHLAETAANYFDQVEALSERRNLLIHGSPAKCWDDAIEFNWLKVQATTHLLERHTVTLDQMRGLADEILDVALPVSRLTHRIMEWVVRNQNEEPNSEVP